MWSFHTNSIVWINVFFITKSLLYRLLFKLRYLYSNFVQSYLYKHVLYKVKLRTKWYICNLHTTYIPIYFAWLFTFTRKTYQCLLSVSPKNTNPFNARISTRVCRLIYNVSVSLQDEFLFWNRYIRNK